MALSFRKVMVYSFLIWFIAGLTFSCNANAGDEHFKWLQPLDDKARQLVVWEDRSRAAHLSDITQHTMIWAPLALAIHKKKVPQYFAYHLPVSLATHVTKKLTLRHRPRGSSDQSFFSGHTSASFAGASFVCAEAKNLCPLALVIAASTGYLRMAGDRHWLSDVVVGAAVGYSLPMVVMGVRW